MARRHVAEGEERVARQEILIAELDRDGHAKLAVTARVVLGTLERSLRLARDDLSLIEGKPDATFQIESLPSGGSALIEN
jgi:hypothetical protein